MYKKRVSWLLSLVLVLTLALSFCVPVSAASDGWSVWQGGYNGTVSKSDKNVTFSTLLSTGQYVTGIGTSSGTATYKTLGYHYAYFNLRTFFVQDGWRYRFRNISCTYGSVSGVVGIDFLIGSVAQVLQDDAQVISGKVSNSNSVYFDGDSSSVSLWLRVMYFGSYQNESFSVSNVTVSYDGIDSRCFGSLVALNYALNNIAALIPSYAVALSEAIYGANQQQTLSLTSHISSTTQNQTDTLTGGYDNSGMENTNKQLADSLASYDQTESQVMDQSVGYIDAVSFFDPTTHLQLMTSITYVSTFLQNLFVSLGDWSVLVMISLSLAFALMLIGWFKYRK